MDCFYTLIFEDVESEGVSINEELHFVSREAAEKFDCVNNCPYYWDYLYLYKETFNSTGTTDYELIWKKEK